MLLTTFEKVAGGPARYCWDVRLGCGRSCWHSGPWTLNIGTWHLAGWRGSFLFESWVLITVNSQGGIWKGREEVASLRPKGKEFLRKEGRGPVVEAQYKRWWSAEIRNFEDGEDVRRWIMRMTWKYSYKEESMDCWMTSIELSALRSRERPKRIHATFNLIVTSSFLIVINSVNFLFIVLILRNSSPDGTRLVSGCSDGTLLARSDRSVYWEENHQWISNTAGCYIFFCYLYFQLHL